MSHVCRFYLLDSCRYGSRCRFSHDVSNNSYGNGRDAIQTKKKWKRDLTQAEVDEVVDTIADEAEQVERGHMWPLTSLSILRGAPPVPGWEDYSMEEIRAAAYSAKAMGCFDDYVDFFLGLQKKAKKNREIFLYPGREAENIVREMFEKRSEGFPDGSFAAAAQGFNRSMPSNITAMGTACVSHNPVSPLGQSMEIESDEDL